ncbi:MAG: hypothetical protein NT014_07395 [Candidatus Omnitrophica bacterium]|nr:hypothetical protein [Candidatus Omnitrophota bacterium]
MINLPILAFEGLFFNIRAVFQIALLYLTLSKEGKCFLKKTIKLSRLHNKISKNPVSLGIRKVLYFIQNFKVCDKVFNRQVSSQLADSLGRSKSAMYTRFIPYSWFSLLIWGKVLDAFNIPYNNQAKERCVLVAFTHREWNDLFDNQGYTFSQLFTAFDYQAQIPQQLIFLRQLKSMDVKLAPVERFSTYHQHMQGFGVCSLFEYTPEKAEIILDQVAPFVALLFLYIMVPNIPEGLKEVSKSAARWLYMLDELTDLEHDKKINRITYMVLAKDPEKALQEQFEKCRQTILRNAPSPDKLIEFMETLTSKIIEARRQGVDIENSFFNLG